MRNRLFSYAAVAALVLGSAGSAAAQGASGTTTTPTFELSAGYQFLRTGEVCTDSSTVQVCAPPEQNFPFGLAVDAARNFGRFALVGEAGWSIKKDDQTVSVGEGTEEIDLTFNAWHLAGGPRVNFGGDKFRPFAQILAGVGQDRVNSDAGDSSTTNFILQPGIGGTIVMGDGWGIVGQIDYRRVFLGDNDDLDELDDLEDLEDELSNGRNDFRIFIGFRMILD